MSELMDPGDDKAKGHTVTIIVNAQEFEVSKGDLSFDEVVNLAFPGGPRGGNWVYTVTYRRGHGQKPEGSLVPGGEVKVKDRMIFNVTQTDKS